jgi:serine/threonine-protein kinase PknK
MAERDSHATQRDLVSGVPAELRDARFDDVEEVGHGGFGLVYRGTQRGIAARAMAIGERSGRCLARIPGNVHG